MNHGVYFKVPDPHAAGLMDDELFIPATGR